ncbi:hypothetical protein [Bradyrhizobium valentinum]|uniref:Helix-turn-helix domain-containing protein n=1 Tax=Bradyrhizobium valentinum TaxID=1518501 RepID=A0A0R3KN28_9BRAD|nr:hypothetical protein [Bradyrhizobium valentinum]KRQ97088.1 hypothetical protein CP49_28770 [Bradyrhizobium valentinum]KRR14408.1 hypothetical protein CQ10_01505 [Bradyrhizobium valentinum]
MTDDPRQKRNLITLKKALERGGFRRTKAYKLIKKGKIVAYKMEGQTMVDADSIDAYHMTLPRIEPSK